MSAISTELVKQETDTRVAKVIDNYTVVINKGTQDNVHIGDKYLFYVIDDEEVIDPITNQPLGCLELVKGIGKVTHVQDKIATIQSNQTKMEIEDQNLWAIPIYSPKSVEKILPFHNIAVGDFVKPI